VVAAGRPAGRRSRDDAEPGESAESGDSTLDLPDGADLAQLMREELARLLLEGDDEALRRFARLAVDQLGRAPASPSGQSYFGYRVMRALSPDTLVAQLLAGLLGGAPGEAGRGGLAEQVARQTVRERLAAFRAAVDAEVRRRAAAERGRERVARSAVRPLAEQVDFLRAQQSDLAELRRAVAPLARRLAVRLSARRRMGRQGRLDFRRTVRASLATGGVPVVTHHRPRKVHKPELVVLCDVSGSVAGFSHFTLMLTQALREHFSGVRAFAFVDSTDEVTRFFRPGATSPTRRADRREADVVGFDGHSDYGTAFEVFADRWAAAVGPKTSLLVLGDGRTNYRPPGCRCWPTWSAGPARRTGSTPSPAGCGAAGTPRPTATARSSTWSSAATPHSSRTSSRPSERGPSCPPPLASSRRAPAGGPRGSAGSG
jgi:uncharacterized protein with von Willebrand factor type A (vWA) domain